MFSVFFSLALCSLQTHVFFVVYEHTVYEANGVHHSRYSLYSRTIRIQNTCKRTQLHAQLYIFKHRHISGYWLLAFGMYTFSHLHTYTMEQTHYWRYFKNYWIKKKSNQTLKWKSNPKMWSNRIVTVKLFASAILFFCRLCIVYLFYGFTLYFGLILVQKKNHSRGTDKYLCLIGTMRIQVMTKKTPE